MRLQHLVAATLIAALAVTSVLAAGRPARYETPEAVVAWLYRDFGWECLFDHAFTDEILVAQPASVLEQYFVPELARLIERDRNESEPGSVGALDFSLLFGSQDPEGIGSLSFTRRQGTDCVLVSYRQNEKPGASELVFDTVKTEEGWRISDVHYYHKPVASEGSTPYCSLKELLLKSLPPKPPQARPHKCPETERAGRLVLSTEEAKRLGAKEVERAPWNFDVTCPWPLAHLGQMVAEVLVDESGAVECVELVKVYHENCAYGEAYIRNLKQWRFTPIRDPQGRPAAYYWPVSLTLKPR